MFGKNQNAKQLSNQELDQELKNTLGQIKMPDPDRLIQKVREKLAKEHEPAQSKD